MEGSDVTVNSNKATAPVTPVKAAVRDARSPIVNPYQNATNNGTASASTPQRASGQNDTANLAKTNSAKKGVKGQQIQMYNAVIPESRVSGYNRRQKPALVVEYTLLGNKVIAHVNLNNVWGNPHYAFKLQFFAEILQTDFGGWADKASHPAFENATVINLREVPNGGNLIKTDNSYNVKGLNMTFLCNPTFEDAQKETEKLANTMLDIIQHDMFCGVYLAYVKNRFQRDTMFNKLKDGGNEFWKCIDTAEIKVLKYDYLDTVYLDEDIAKFIGGKIRQKPVETWPDSCIRKLYKSGVLPDHFGQLLAMG